MICFNLRRRPGCSVVGRWTAPSSAAGTYIMCRDLSGHCPEFVVCSQSEWARVGVWLFWFLIMSKNQVFNNKEPVLWTYNKAKPAAIVHARPYLVIRNVPCLNKVVVNKLGHEYHLLKLALKRNIMTVSFKGWFYFFFLVCTVAYATRTHLDHVTL